MKLMTEKPTETELLEDNAKLERLAVFFLFIAIGGWGLAIAAVVSLLRCK